MHWTTAGSKEKKKAGGVTTTGKSYEEEFDLEMARLKVGERLQWSKGFAARKLLLCRKTDLQQCRNGGAELRVEGMACFQDYFLI